MKVASKWLGILGVLCGGSGLVGAQSVSIGWSAGGGAKAKPAEARQEPRAQAAPAARNTNEQLNAWADRLAKSKAAKALAAILADSADEKSCVNLAGGVMEDNLKALLADLSEIDALRRDCEARTFGANATCEVLGDANAYQRRFSHVFTCQMERSMADRRAAAKEVAKSMTVELGELAYVQSPEAWIEHVSHQTQKVFDRAKQLGVDLSALEAQRSETEALERSIFDNLHPAPMKATEKNASAEKAASDAVSKATGAFGCKTCKVVRSAVVGDGFVYERNGFGVVTWRGKNTQTIVQTPERRVCGVVDGRAGQVAVGSRFVPNYNAFVPVRFLHLVACK